MRRNIGFVFQFYNLISNLNVEENILLPVLLDGNKTKDYKKTIIMVTHSMETAEYGNRIVNVKDG